MFDFEQLSVYQKSMVLTKRIFLFLKVNQSIDRFLQDQLKRASVSISANIAEGSGRFTLADKRHFYVISRGSAFESFSLLQTIAHIHLVDAHDCADIKKMIEEIARMLCGLINHIQHKSALETLA